MIDGALKNLPGYHARAGGLRAAAGHRGRGGGDPPVLDPLHRGKELLAWEKTRTRLDPGAGGTALARHRLARALLPRAAAPHPGLLVRDKRRLRRHNARLQPGQLPQGLRPAVSGDHGPHVRHRADRPRSSASCSATLWLTSSPSRAAGASNALILLVMIPFWTSLLSRAYAWVVILGGNGIANRALQFLAHHRPPVDPHLHPAGGDVGHGLLVSAVHDPAALRGP